MRIAVATFGSEGDVRPFIALAKGLRRAGEDAFLVAPGMFEARAREHGVPFVDSGARMEQAWSEATARRVLAQRHPLRQARIIWQSFEPEILRSVGVMAEAFRGAGAVVHHGFDPASYAAALASKLPRFAVSLFPSALHNELRFGGVVSLGRPLNRLLSRWMRNTFARVTQPVFARAMEAAGVQAPPRALLEATGGAFRALVAISPSFVPGDPGWGENAVQTGYWFLDVPEFAPPAPLRDFLAAGPPPVVVSLGSVRGIDAKRQTELLVEALERAGQRGILQAGWAQLGGEVALPKTVLRVEHVPHDWLLPRAACVVHHAGAGTTAAVLRAGVPHVPVWHVGDEQAWALLLWRHGVTPGFPRGYQRVTAKSLAASIRKAVSSPEIRQRAAALGQQIRAEDGVGAAVEAIRTACSAGR